ncbi:MAG: hypothetical protein H0V74_08750, partial [Chloroflexi bacterium]|nr:hypothetical protein [Chloroflexota bacterium]
MPDRPARARQRRVRRLVLVVVGVVLVGSVAAGGTVATNTLGIGTRFENLVERVALALDPPPDRPTRPTVTITPP